MGEEERGGREVGFISAGPTLRCRCCRGSHWSRDRSIPGWACPPKHHTTLRLSPHPAHLRLSLSVGKSGAANQSTALPHCRRRPAQYPDRLGATMSAAHLVFEPQSTAGDYSATSSQISRLCDDQTHVLESIKTAHTCPAHRIHGRHRHLLARSYLQVDTHTQR